MEDDAEPFGVWPKNWETVAWFMRLQRRWVVGQMGGYIRLDDQAIHAQMALAGVKKKRRASIMDGLLVMEAAALEILNVG